MSDLSAFGVNHGYEIEKSLTGLIPAQRVGGFKGATKADKLKRLVEPYKGGTQKTKSSLPLQAKLAGARLDRKRGRI